jgi:hypothetical protein
MRTAQTFWRYHNKPRALPRRVLSHTPKPGAVAQVRQLMQQAIDAACASGLPRPLFPFTAADVETVYTHKTGVGKGLWFGLIDGRVFNDDGEPDSNDPDLYERANDGT